MDQDTLIRLLRRRTWAGWIDVLLLFFVSVLISAATGNLHSGKWSTLNNGALTQHSGFSVDLPTGPFLGWLAIATTYYAFAELLTGQTIGKAVMGLKVIMVSGQPLGGGAVIIRTLARVIDALPAFYLIGWILMRGPRRPPQRFGDRLAGTTVVPVSHP